MKFIRVWACAVALMVGTSGAMAQTSESAPGKPNVIQNLEVGKAGGNTVIKIGLQQVLTAAPSNFVIANPARVVFDFPATENGLGFSNKTVNEGGLRSYNLVQAGERSRLVLNLDKASRFETRQDGKDLIVTLFDEGAAVAVSKTEATQHFAPSSRDAVASIRDVQFRRNKEGAGVIMVDLSSSDTGIDVKQQGKNLLVSFKKTQLPELLRRRLDVVDFGTPVTAVNTRQDGDGITMEITPTGLWEHTAYQSDNQFVVEVRPVKEDPNKLFQGSRKGYQGEAISLNFQNIPLRELLHVFADITNFNIVISDSVGGNVSLRLNDVPWDQALEIVLQQKNLAMRKNGSVIWIAPQDELAARDDQMVKARESAAVADPPRLELFQLSYVKAEDLLTMLKQEKQDTKGKDSASAFLSSIGKITIDKRTNQVFIYDVPSKLEMIRAFLKEIDKPVRQVLIEARIVEANTQFSKALGARLGANDIRGQTVGHSILGNDGLKFGLGQTLPSFTGTGAGATLTQFNNALLSNNGISSTKTPTGQFALTLFNSSMTQLLTLEIQAQEADGKGKTVSSPRIMTMDQMEADIKQGVRVPYLEASASGATSIKYVDAVLSLKVKPQITPDGSVMMKLKINKDELGASSAIGREIRTKEVNSDVLVENGGTIVIGGIFEQAERTDTSRVPFFGDLPYVGFMFKNNVKTEERTELLVMITPRIIDSALTVK